MISSHPSTLHILAQSWLVNGVLKLKKKTERKKKEAKKKEKLKINKRKKGYKRTASSSPFLKRAWNRLWQDYEAGIIEKEVR